MSQHTPSIRPQLSHSALTRRQFLAGAMAAGAAFACGWPAARAAAPSSRKPNFLVIIADDMGYADAGCYGGEIQTPNLDKLAAAGLRFSQFYSTGRCWPSRSALLTGYYPQQIRMDPPQGPLPAWTRVMPHYLKPLGYRCYHTGKWHLNGAPRPVADGAFDRSYKIDDHDRFFAPKKATLDDQPLPPVEEGSGFYLTTAIAQYGLDFLKQHQSEHAADPFCLYLAFTSPHFPLQAKKEDIDVYRDKFKEGWDVMRRRRYERQRQIGLVTCDLPPLEPGITANWSLPEEELQRQIGPGEEGHAVPWDSLTPVQKEYQATKMAIHAAMIHRMDIEIGRVLDQIRAMGAFDDTVIFFVSDNGATAEQIIRGDMNDPKADLGSGGSYLCLGPGWSSCSNTPFRLHKHWNHEGGIASPLIVHWTAGLKARGELRHNPGHFVDLLPTLIDLAGGGPVTPVWNDKPAPPLPGRSLVPAFTRDGAVTRDFIYFNHQGNHALRVGDWKLVARVDKEGKTRPWELYDLKSDRCEMKDLAQAQPDRVSRMAALWEKQEALFREQAGPPPASAAKAGRKGKKAAGAKSAKRAPKS